MLNKWGGGRVVSTSCSSHRLGFPLSSSSEEPLPFPHAPGYRGTSRAGRWVSEQSPGPDLSPSPAQGPWPLSLLGQGGVGARWLCFWLQQSPGAWMRPLCREGGHCRSQPPQGAICLPGPHLPHPTKTHQHGLAGSPLSSFQLRGMLARGASWEQGAEGLRAGWV